MSQMHNFVIKSATGLILGKEQISVVPTMADVLASISERLAANNRKGGTR